MTAPIPRPAVRLLLLDGSGRLLLQKIDPPDGHELWITPGGGIDEGEDDTTAAHRELYEETGIQGVDLGPCVWTRTHVVDWEGTLYELHERFYLARTAGDVSLTQGSLVDPLIVEQRWWTLDELRASTDVFAPRGLVGALTEILRDGPPAQPYDVGV